MELAGYDKYAGCPCHPCLGYIQTTEEWSSRRMLSRRQSSSRRAASFCSSSLMVFLEEGEVCGELVGDAAIPIPDDC